MMRTMKVSGRGVAAMAAIGLSASAATAGGFAIKEQGALGQGSSFAGAGASTAPSAMFFNSAAVTSNDGLNFDASITWITPDATLTATTGSTLLNFPGVNQSAQIGRDAYVPSTAITYQLKNYDPRMYIGLAVNSPFGLKTEPDQRWAGSTVGGAASVFTIDFNPTLGYKFSDQFSAAIGAQFEYGKAIFKFASGTPTGPNTFFDGESGAVGATAGLMYTPTPATRIGLGWRSQMTHELDGRFASSGSPVSAAFLSSKGACASPAACAATASFLNSGFNIGQNAKAELRLPDIVTLSLSQAIAPNARLLGTIEWSNWSRLKSLDVVATGTGTNLLAFANSGGLTQSTAVGSKIGSLSAAWDDGWFFSGGLEYDVSSALTVRAGGAYEISPISDPTQRLSGIPDANRIWASAGFSYAISQSTTFDFGYSHIFVDNVQADRTGLATQPFPIRIVANLDASVDIVSVGMRMKLGQ